MIIRRISKDEIEGLGWIPQESKGISTHQLDGFCSQFIDGFPDEAYMYGIFFQAEYGTYPPGCKFIGDTARTRKKIQYIQ